tara:strand:+ start:552 stop:758 length:207 start_codon:yes stop_codon:yes gene_type:complete
MKKVLIIGAMDLGISMTRLTSSCVELNDSIKTTTEIFDELKVNAEYVNLKQENKHPFDKFINGKTKRK